MPVGFSRDDSLQTLTDSQQNHCRILENINILVFECVLVGTVLPMMSSGFVEFYIPDFWIVQ